MTEIHDALGGDIAFRNADVFHEVDGKRILGNVDLLELVKKVVQRAFILGGADQLVVDIERIAIGNKTDLVGKVLLKLRLVRQFAAADKRGAVMNEAGCGSVAAVPQGLSRNARDLLGGAFGNEGIADRVDVRTVIGNRGAEGVE